MIVTVVAHDEGADLGRAYNEVMRRVGDDDWVCFLDHDAMFTTRTWFIQLSRAVEDRPEVGLFGVMTNRVGNPDQELPGVDPNNHDVAYHRRLGRECAEDRHPATRHWPEYVDVDHPGKNWLAGVVMLTSKRAWLQAQATKLNGEPCCGFQEGYLFGVDNAYHAAQRRAGNPAVLLSRVYVYHWFRAGGDDQHVKALAGKYSYRP